MEFSSGSIGLPPTSVGQTPPAAEWGDVTELMWPGYRRTTALAGGDLEASFAFAGHAPDLQDQFAYLGAEFHEQYAGFTCFRGFVYEFRLVAQRLHLTYSLADVYNTVACSYRSALDGRTSLTDFVVDQASLQKWGRRTLILPLVAPVDLIEAQDVAQAFLADYAQPRILRSGLAAAVERPTLKVVIRGYATALDDDIYNQTVEGTDLAHLEVAATLTGNMAGPGGLYVTTGAVADNPVSVSIQADNRPRLQRIADIAQARDSQGRRYRFGCFAGRAFDYQPVSADLRYRVGVDPGRGSLVHETAAGEYVPAPLVQPGGWSLYAPDLFNSAPAAATPAEMTGAQLDESVVYQDGTAVLQGGRRDTRTYLEGVMMAMVAARRDWQ